MSNSLEQVLSFFLKDSVQSYDTYNSYSIIRFNLPPLSNQFPISQKVNLYGFTIDQTNDINSQEIKRIIERNSSHNEYTSFLALGIDKLKEFKDRSYPDNIFRDIKSNMVELNHLYKLIHVLDERNGILQYQTENGIQVDFLKATEDVDNEIRLDIPEREPLYFSIGNYRSEFITKNASFRTDWKNYKRPAVITLNGAQTNNNLNEFYQTPYEQLLEQQRLQQLENTSPNEISQPYQQVNQKEKNPRYYKPGRDTPTIPTFGKK